MSNSYKRTQNGQKRDWLPKIFHNEIFGDDKRRYFDPAPEKIYWLLVYPHRVADIDDWFYWLRNPSWYNHDYSTVPRRVEERRLQRGIIKGEFNVDEIVWPLDHKPHVWYW